MEMIITTISLTLLGVSFISLLLTVGFAYYENRTEKDLSICGESPAYFFGGGTILCLVLQIFVLIFVVIAKLLGMI